MPEGFDWVYAHMKRDVCLSSISGGTDIISCFVGGNPIGPVWRGEIQARPTARASTCDLDRSDLALEPDRVQILRHDLVCAHDQILERIEGELLPPSRNQLGGWTPASERLRVTWLTSLVELFFRVTATEFHNRPNHDLGMFAPERHLLELGARNRRRTPHPIH